jgi:hypothetical protein
MSSQTIGEIIDGDALAKVGIFPARPELQLDELKQFGELGRRCHCRPSPYWNNIIEQDHRHALSGPSRQRQLYVRVNSRAWAACSSVVSYGPRGGLLRIDQQQVANVRLMRRENSDRLSLPGSDGCAARCALPRQAAIGNRPASHIFRSLRL